MAGEQQLPSPPGYGPIVPLDRDAHRGLGVRENPGFAAGLHAVYLTAIEILRAARDYPIVFARDAGNSWFPMTLTGLQAGRNLFVSNGGAWRTGCYVPAYVRRHPFCTVLARREPEPQVVVCVEQAALDAGAPALFDADGKPTANWLRYEKLIQEMESARQATERFTASIAEHNLLEPFEAHAHPAGGQPLHVKGLFRVSEARLNKLPGKAVKALMTRGELSRIYAHLLSLDNFANLLDLHAATQRAA